MEDQAMSFPPEPPSNESVNQAPFAVIASNKAGVLDKYGFLELLGGHTDTPWYKPWDQLSFLNISRVLPEDVTSLVESLCFYYGKKHVLYKHSTRHRGKKQFVCTHCKFEIVCLRNSRGGKDEPYTIQEPVGDHDPTCPMLCTIPNRDVLENLPEFFYFVRHAILDGKDTSMSMFKKHIITMGLTLELSKIKSTTYFHCWHSVRSLVLNQLANDYVSLPTYLQAYKANNPSATVAIQRDEDGQFFRMFVSVPHAKELLESSLPIIFFDGAHSKSLLYDGVILIAVCKNGNGATMPLAISWVPSETCSHVGWMIMMLLRCEIDIQQYPIFSDRGNLLAAATSLKHMGIDLSIKYDLEHLIRNILHKFSIKSQQEISSLRHYMAKLQSSSSMTEYFDTIATLFYHDWTSISDSKDLALYILKIHPTHWTVFGNDQKYSMSEDFKNQHLEMMEGILIKLFKLGEETDLMQQVKNAALEVCGSHSVPIGKPFPLFNHARSNVVESAINALGHHGVRSQHPPMGVMTWIQCAGNVISKFLRELSEIVKTCSSNAQSNTMTTIGMKAWKSQELSTRLMECMSLTQMEESGDTYILVVVKSSSLASTGCSNYNVHNVLLGRSKVSCDCTHWKQMRVPCAHSRFACQKAIADNLMDPDYLQDHYASNNLPPWFVARKVAEKVKLSVVKHPASFDVVSKCTLFGSRLDGPPRYYDRRSGSKKRYKSCGEKGSGNTVSPSKAGTTRRIDHSRTTYGSRMVSRQKPSARFLEQHFPEPDFLSGTMQTTTGAALVEMKKLYRCSECHSQEHTLRRCPMYLSGNRVLKPHAEVVPSGYAIYKSRFHLQVPPQEVLAISSTKEVIKVHDVCFEVFESSAIQEIEDLIDRNYLNYTPGQLPAESNERVVEEPLVLEEADSEMPTTSEETTMSLPGDKPQTDVAAEAGETQTDVAAEAAETQTDVAAEAAEQCDDCSELSSDIEPDPSKPKAPLEVGDRIHYYNPVFVTGNPMGEREATVLEVYAVAPGSRHRENHIPLKLSNGEIIPGDTWVKNLTTGIGREIMDFTMVPGKLKGGNAEQKSHFAKLRKKVDEIRETASKIPEHLQTLLSHATDSEEQESAIKPKSLFGNANNEVAQEEPPTKKSKVAEEASNSHTIDSVSMPSLPWSMKSNGAYAAITNTCHIDAILAMFYALHFNKAFSKQLFELTHKRAKLRSALEFIKEGNPDEARRNLFRSLKCYEGGTETLNERTMRGDSTVNAAFNALDPMISLLAKSSTFILKASRSCSEPKCPGKTLEHYVGYPHPQIPNAITALNFSNTFPKDLVKALESKLKVKEFTSNCQRKKCGGGCKNEQQNPTDATTAPFGNTK